jgi:hypothetical protein
MTLTPSPCWPKRLAAPLHEFAHHFRGCEVQTTGQGSLQVPFHELTIPAIAEPSTRQGAIDRARKLHVTIRSAKVNSNRIHFDQDERLLSTYGWRPRDHALC